MVDGVAGTTKVMLHQTLHGYADGHRQISASMSLKARDTKTLLVLSDSSGPGARLNDAGYLTGYPLPEAGYYALARTWPAPEMMRPGCVWTHTLLIDFADLASVYSPGELLGAFRRPGTISHDAFDKPIIWRLPRRQLEIDEADLPAARRIVGALYGKPEAKIISARAFISNVERLVTVLWSQQWPRLRRTFRFCTSAASDRSMDGAPFDLQFLPEDSGALWTRFPKAVDAEDYSESGDWLNEALEDLVRPTPEGLRDFLLRIGGDVPGGRGVFPSLCQLYGLNRTFATKPEALEQAVRLLTVELGDAPARAARAAVAAAALPQADLLSEGGLNYLLNHLSAVEPVTIATFSATLGRALLHRRPSTLAGMMDTDGVFNNLARDAIRNATEPELLTAIQASPEFALPILKLRPTLAASPGIWSPALRAEESAFAALGVHDRPQAVVIAMIAAGREDLAGQATRRVGALVVLQALSSLLQSEPLVGHDYGTWLLEAAQPGAVTQLLCSHDGQPRQLLALLARVMRPDDVPNDYGEDPWLSAFHRAEGTISDHDETLLCAFLLARSLGWRSRNQGELAQVAFEHTHAAAATNCLYDESWKLLEPLIPRSWVSWDRCQRLRAGVVDLFVENRLAPELFGRLVQSEPLFELLADQASRTWAGRRYLKDVRRALTEAPEPSYPDRGRYINKLLK